MRPRLVKLESTAGKISAHLVALERDVALIRSDYATQADIAASQSTLRKWFVGTAVTLAGLTFAAAKLIN